MSSETPYISVVIPVYRAERILPTLCERLAAVLTSIGRPYEILLVDDRSPDGSWRVISELAPRYRITAIRLSRNFGQHHAITAGLDHSRGEWTVLMDCDLQDPPEEIPALLAAAEAGHDIVLARRTLGAHGVHKRALSRVFYRLFNWLSGYDLDPTVGAFRIMRRNVVDAYRTMREASRLIGGMSVWLGFETATIDVAHSARFEGRSSYDVRKLIHVALDGVISFSNRPLYLSIVIGFLFSLLSAGFGASLVIRYLLDPRIGVPGWLTLVALTAFIGGLILLNLGILGIYVGRIYDQSKQRPLYVVDQIVVEGRLPASRLDPQTAAITR